MGPTNLFNVVFATEVLSIRELQTTVQDLTDGS